MTFNAFLDVAFDLGYRLIEHGRLDMRRNPKTDEDAWIKDQIALYHLFSALNRSGGSCGRES